MSDRFEVYTDWLCTVGICAENGATADEAATWMNGRSRYSWRIAEKGRFSGCPPEDEEKRPPARCPDVPDRTHFILVSGR